MFVALGGECGGKKAVWEEEGDQPLGGKGREGAGPRQVFSLLLPPLLPLCKRQVVYCWQWSRSSIGRQTLSPNLRLCVLSCIANLGSHFAQCRHAGNSLFSFSAPKALTQPAVPARQAKWKGRGVKLVREQRGVASGLTDGCWEQEESGSISLIGRDQSHQLQNGMRAGRGEVVVGTDSTGAFHSGNAINWDFHIIWDQNFIDLPCTCWSRKLLGKPKQDREHCGQCRGRDVPQLGLVCTTVAGLPLSDTAGMHVINLAGQLLEKGLKKNQCWGKFWWWVLVLFVSKSSLATVVVHHHACFDKQR